MGLKELQLIFDNPYATFYSGQQVSGRLVVSLDAPKKIRGISIHFKGEANVKWEESESTKDSQGNDKSVTITYTGSEKYFENKYNLLGGSGADIELPSGQHNYPFTTILPPNLPSSFEGEFGHVRYTVKAVLDRPWKFDQEVKAAFTVVSPLDLNLDQNAKAPLRVEKQKTFCCLWCKSGPLTIDLTAPVGGYVPGQEIPLTVEINNSSNVNITSCKCSLKKLLAFHATSPNRSSKHDSVKISELKFDAVPAGQSNSWTKQVPIPPLPPSNLGNCNIIDLTYEIKLVAEVSGMHSNMEVKAPIILGTVPLLSFQVPMQGAPEGFQQQVPAPEPSGPALQPGVVPSYPQQDPAQPNAPYPKQIGFNMPESGGPEPSAPLYPSIAPPTFAEYEFGKKNIQDAGDNQYVHGDMEFAPRYPVYNFTKP